MRIWPRFHYRWCSLLLCTVHLKFANFYLRCAVTPRGQKNQIFRLGSVVGSHAWIRIRTVSSSVSDPDCAIGVWIPESDPGSRLSPVRIPYPHYPYPGSRIRVPDLASGTLRTLGPGSMLVASVGWGILIFYWFILQNSLDCVPGPNL
jgi:hypothetical protein